MFSEEQNKKMQQLNEALEAGILTKEEYDKKVNELVAAESVKMPQEQDGFYHYGETKPPLKEQNQTMEDSQKSIDDGVVYFRENPGTQQPHSNPQAQQNSAYQNSGTSIPPQKSPKQKKNLFGKFKAFWNRNKRNKILAIIGSVLVVIILIGIVGNIGSRSHESYDWPDNDMAKMLPEPEGKITYLTTSEGSSIYADIKTDKESYLSYVKKCKKKGFTEEKDESQIEESYYYSAENSDAYSLSVNYDGKIMNISLDAPMDQNSSTEATKETTSNSSSSGVSPDFKSTMDSYESFMNKYVDFMKKYENSDDTSGMLSEYSDIMQEYSDFAKKVDAIDEDSLSESDYAYYMEVMTRVNKKLLEI